MIWLRLPSLSFLSAGLLGASLAFCFAPAKAAEGYDPWPGLVQDVFNNKPMQDGANVLSIEMPARAEDASVVPVTLRSKLSPADEQNGFTWVASVSIKFAYVEAPGMPWRDSMRMPSAAVREGKLRLERADGIKCETDA